MITTAHVPHLHSVIWTLFFQIRWWHIIYCLWLSFKCLIILEWAFYAFMLIFLALAHFKVWASKNIILQLYLTCLLVLELLPFPTGRGAEWPVINKIFLAFTGFKPGARLSSMSYHWLLLMIKCIILNTTSSIIVIFQKDEAAFFRLDLI